MSQQTVKLISLTKGCGELENLNAEQLIAYAARVSNPQNQDNHESGPKLLKYCIKHQHWSIFETANMCLEVVTSRAIAAQILRHRSFSFQEFSQRYASSTNFITFDARRQDLKNKQNSIDDMSEDTKNWFLQAQDLVETNATHLYNEALEKGIAKEQARCLLPLSTETTLYMNGSIRSWMHYIGTRSDVSTQLEHRQIALMAKDIFIKELPTISAALEWTNISENKA